MSAKKKAVRQSFRDTVFDRDNLTCRVCGVIGTRKLMTLGQNMIHADKLDAHHITDRSEMPNGGYVKENGITLCPRCHEDAEEYHRTEKKHWISGLHPNDLYDLIGSSYEEALEASEKLR